MHVKVLSVAEDNYCSNRISMTHSIVKKGERTFIPGTFKMQITPPSILNAYASIDENKTFKIRLGKDEIVIPEVDIDGLIDYLVQAKEFLSEQELVNKLSGKVQPWK